MGAPDPVVAAMRSVLPAGAVLDDPDVVGSYARDQAMFTAAGLPRAVALPRTADEVAAVLRVASENRVPVVPRGAGSGLAGAANGLDGGIQLVLTGMDRILEIDPDNRLAVVEPGVVTADLRKAVEAEGLFYPPDPASYDWCNHRRQPVHRRRRPVLRQVRRDQRLRARAGGRAGVR